ncbi:MAG TPA: hypothetical protein P5150_01680 [Candidatus Ratteibacteria bacterium]|nr:hypothetical protein [Candidatus Ratteibacteria bacterium]
MEKEERQEEKQGVRRREIDTQLLEKTEWFMEKIKNRVNNNLKEWELPIRIMQKKVKGNPYYFWAEQKRRPGEKEGGEYRPGIYKYLGTNFTWKRINWWNKWRRKWNPKRGWIFSFTGKKLSRWNRELQKLYRVRRSIKQIQRDKKRAEKKIKKLIVDLIGVFGLGDLKYCVRKGKMFSWVRILEGVDKEDLWGLSRMLGRIEGEISKKKGMEKEKKKWVRKISKAKEEIEKIIKERKKIHKRVGKKLYEINKRIIALDNLWYSKPEKTEEDIKKPPIRME